MPEPRWPARGGKTRSAGVLTFPRATAHGMDDSTPAITRSLYYAMKQKRHVAAALSFLVVFVGAHHTETRSATGPDASPIVTMAFSLCVAVGGVARAAPPRSASRSASRQSHIIRCAEPERRSGSVAPRVTRRAFGAGAALVAAGLESSTKAARAFERPPPGASRARSRDPLRARRANAALSSTSVDAKSACFFFPSRSGARFARLFARASSLHATDRR